MDGFKIFSFAAKMCRPIMTEMIILGLCDIVFITIFRRWYGVDEINID